MRARAVTAAAIASELHAQLTRRREKGGGRVIHSAGGAGHAAVLVEVVSGTFAADVFVVEVEPERSPRRLEARLEAGAIAMRERSVLFYPILVRYHETLARVPTHTHSCVCAVPDVLLFVVYIQNQRKNGTKRDRRMQLFVAVLLRAAACSALFSSLAWPS